MKNPRKKLKNQKYPGFIVALRMTESSVVRSFPKMIVQMETVRDMEKADINTCVASANERPATYLASPPRQALKG
ncbi:MAG: hypothetical protein ACREQX_07780 [Candidatus Binataceae bacterium]